MLGRSPFVVSIAALVAGLFVAASSGQGPPIGGQAPSPQGLQAALAAQERHLDSFLERAGVVGMGVGLSAGRSPVIRVYVERPAVAAAFPSALDGVPVQVVTTGVVMARAPTDRFPRPVPIGVSSGHPDVSVGTLGARVTDGTNVYALSNNHIFAASNMASIGDGVLQPGTVDGGVDPADRIGTLHDFQPINFGGGDNVMDAAIALTSATNVGTATPPDGYGTPSPVTTAAYVGQAVQKFGRTTGHTTGTVVEINVTVDVCYVFFVFCFQEARFVNQVAIGPDAFSEGGDSGSLIVTQGSKQPVALLFAGGDGRTYGNPIDLVLDRFGITVEGETTTATVPSAPNGLTATPDDGAVNLAWQPPASDGGSPLTGYRVYRGTAPGSETFLTSLGAVTSFVDTSVTNDTTYSYRVSAENAVGEGPLSGAVSATPTSQEPPLEPLSVLDSFDRPNENPLSDSGRWGNGVVGSGETGLRTSSNQLYCGKTSTCSGWRNTGTFGPDAEAYARIAALPGNGNAIRLYVRLQSPGGAAADGYLLRTNQLAGTDQVFLERLDNGVLTTRLTIAQELAVGDTLLLRALGSTLEAWRLRAGSWSRLGLVTDTTYASAGYVGVGLRGSSGRLDDFGGR